MHKHLGCAAALAALLMNTSALAGDIAGQVTGPDGKPVAGAKVALPDLLRNAVTDRDGRFRFEALPEVEADLIVDAPGLSTASQRVRIPAKGEANPVFTLQRSDAIARAALLHGEPATEHQSQKAAYLEAIKPLHGKVPNIVVVLFDDLGYGDLSSYGNKLIKTPNIDAVAQRGVRLEEFYSASPVCTPSRASIMTGRYPTRSYAANHVFFPSDSPVATIRRSLGWANALPADEILLPEVLARAGYATGAFGKWHLGDQPGHRPNDFGFGQYFGILYSNDMNPTTLWRNREVDTPADKTDQATLAERITDEAIAFVRKNAGRPFFAYVPYTAPHLPHFPNPKHKGVSEGGTYGDVIEDLDSNVGRLLGTLKDLKLDDNTIVLVMSDNGGDYGGSVGNLRGRKGETFEGGQRVPAFVIWPGVTRPGTTSREMAMNIDLLPTILDALGVPLPGDRVVDGKDIRSILSGGRTPHDFLYYVTTWSGQYEAVRDRTYKYRDIVPNESPLGGGTSVPYNAKPSLYALKLDNESLDVTARHPDEQARLKSQLDAFRALIAQNPRGWQTE